MLIQFPLEASEVPTTNARACGEKSTSVTLTETGVDCSEKEDLAVQSPKGGVSNRRDGIERSLMGQMSSRL